MRLKSYTRFSGWLQHVNVQLPGRDLQSVVQGHIPCNCHTLIFFLLE